MKVCIGFVFFICIRMKISDELIEGMAKLPKVVPYFDIPISPGADTMLERMNRRGNSDDALRLIDKIRQTFDDPTLRTTYIVGFPHMKARRSLIS